MRLAITFAFCLIANRVDAKATALVCLFDPSKERFNLVSIDQGNFIQWGGGKFEGVVAKFQSPYLTVTQYGYSGTFCMIYNAPLGKGYGILKGFNGETIEGDIICGAE